MESSCSSSKRSFSKVDSADVKSVESKQKKKNRVYNFSGSIKNAFINTSIQQMTFSLPHQVYSDHQINKFCNDLETSLKENADEIASYDTADLNPITGKNSKYVTLEISNETCHGEKTFSGCSVAFEDFFEDASRYALAEVKNWENDKMKTQYQLLHGNIVGLCGPSGSGKTTVTRQIVKKILEENLYNIKYIFYIKLRDVCYDRETTLLKFLLSSSSFFWEHKTEKDNSILKIIHQCNDVIIIMDGLDEAIFANSQSRVRKMLLFEEAKPEIMIKNLLAGNIFPNAKKLVTSRPHQILQLQHEYQPRFILNIRGLSQKSQLEVCKTVCGDIIHAEKVYNYISMNSKLLSFCSNPINCNMIAFCMKKNLQRNAPGDLTKFITYIVALVHDTYIQSDHLPDDYTYTGLADLAWKGIISNNHYYSEEELAAASISTEQLDTFFNVSIEPSVPSAKIPRRLKRRSFTHSIYQEFFAAYKLRFHTSSSDLQDIVPLLFETRFELVSKFLFGMFNIEISNSVSLMQQPNADINENFKKLDILKEFGLEQLKKVFENKSRQSLAYLSQICNCAYELHNKDFAKIIASALGNGFNMTGDVFPGDVIGLHYVLHLIEKDNFNLSIGPCLTFRENSLKMFFKDMQVTLDNRNVSLTKVDLSRNAVGDEEIHAICGCLHKVQNLSLTDCKLDTFQIKILSDYIRNELPNSLDELNLSCNKLDDKSAVCLAACLNKVNTVHISNCKMSLFFFEQLTKAIKVRDHPLNHFCTSLDITTEKLQALSKCIDKIENLVIGFRHENNNVAVGIDALCSAIANRPQPMERFCLRGSHIGDEGLISVSKCLKNVKKLRLGNSYDDNLTSFGIQELATAFSKLRTPMEEFVFICPTEYTVEINTEFGYCSDKILKLDIR